MSILKISSMVHARVARITGVLVFAAAAAVLTAAPARADDGPSCETGRERSCVAECDDTVAGTVTTTRSNDGSGGGERPGRRTSELVTEDEADGDGRDVGGGEHDEQCLPPVVVPEAPLAVLLPLSAAGVAGVVLLRRERRLRRPVLA